MIDSPMYSLYHSLLAQHSRQLTPVSCAGSTIAQLQRYFEDVVIENNLAALVVESLPATAVRPPREVTRIKELDQAAKNFFLWVACGGKAAARDPQKEFRGGKPPPNPHRVNR